MPKSEGPCRAYMPMWYYEASIGLCGRFIYGGCGGNANRFNNQIECEAKCGHHPTLGATTQHHEHTTTTHHHHHHTTSTPHPHHHTTTSSHHHHRTTTPHHRRHTTPAHTTTTAPTTTAWRPPKTTPGDNNIEPEVTGLGKASGIGDLIW